jgi:hypothetical protein
MIVEISPDEVLGYCYEYLHLSKEDNNYELLLIEILRRTAGIVCPCSRRVLKNSLLKSLSYLPVDSEELPQLLDSLIEKLIIVGDLLELSDVSIDDQKVSGAWIFAAPPSFVKRDNGRIILLGITPDQESFLSSELEERITNNGVLRQIEAFEGENLEEVLIDQGMNQLSESSWLKAPRKVTPEKLLSSLIEKLEQADNNTEINGLEIIAPGTNVNYYKGRWFTPSNQVGTYIGRRPQEFGSPIWCIVELNGVISEKLLDLPLKGYRWRACDAAWHIQMAIDALNGSPQRYSKFDVGEGVRYEFYSPIPLWIQRRLMILGCETTPKNGLLAFVIPYAEADQEEANLKNTLWLGFDEKSTEGH